MLDEPHRPAFHFSAERSWINDPNGLVYYCGEYHLFYQHNPHGTDWGNMSWGHAVSSDLIHWTDLPVALKYAEQEHVFSGSVVVDHGNTSGLGAEGVPAMVAIYTAYDPSDGRQAQALAWSIDQGRTWTRYAANPVLDIGSTDFRDPKVIWYERGGYWVMTVALSVDRVIRLYRSDDLASWSHLSDFTSQLTQPGIWECPDLFELSVDDDSEDTRWVLVLSLVSETGDRWSGVQYFVGWFDGTEFIPDRANGEPLVFDHGADCYAAVSFGDAPSRDRRILMGWMSNWAYARETPSLSFRGAMTVPRVVALQRVGDRIRLVQEPVPALASLRTESCSLEDHPIPPGVMPLPGRASGNLLEIRAVLRPEGAERVGIHVRMGDDERTVVGYDAATRSVFVDRRRSGRVDFGAGFPAVHRAPVSLRDGALELRLLIDNASIEVFAEGGRVVITDQIFPSPDSSGIELFAEGGTAHAVQLETTMMVADAMISREPAAELE